MRRGLMFIMLLPIFVRAQNITTYGGGVTTGICEGCPATTSSIANPVAGIFDKFGNYFFASCLGGNRIRKISSTGTITTIAGTGAPGFAGDGGLAIAAKLNMPYVAKLDSSGNIYISDHSNCRIRKINALTGIISTIAGIGVVGFNGDGIPATTAKLLAADICLDKLNNVYVADYDARRVRKIDTAGIITTIAGVGTVGYSGDGGPATAAELNPSGIVFDDTGNLYIADPYANVVRKINTSGIISTIAGNGAWVYAGDGIPATAAQIQPWWLAVDSLNNIYISDKFNLMVFKVNTVGILYRVAGNGMTGFSGDGGPATSASLDFPTGVAIDPCGNLYVSEATNSRIRKVTFNTCNPALSAISTIVNSTITIHPNPANYILNIENIKSSTTYKLVNTVGSTVQSGNLEEGNTSISIALLPPNMYMLQLTDEAGRRTVKKIMKQ